MGVAARLKKLKLNEAKVGGSFNYFEALEDGSRATFKVKVKKIHIVEMRNDKGEMFTAEHTLLETNHPKFRPGMTISYCVKLSGNDSAGPNLVRYFAGCDGTDTGDEEAMAETDWDEYGEVALSDDQPLTDTILFVTAEKKEAKNPKKHPKTGDLYLPEYTNCRFMRLDA